METIAMTHPADFVLAVRISSDNAYDERSNVLLARASPDGVLELLTAGWEKLLGYRREELSGKTLRQLIKSGAPADAVAAILDHHNMAPVELTLRCRDGEPAHLRLHRRFDEYGQKMFIVAEEALYASTQTQWPAGASLNA
jgi:PAS domain S-box-containing protein